MCLLMNIKTWNKTPETTCGKVLPAVRLTKQTCFGDLTTFSLDLNSLCCCEPSPAVDHGHSNDNNNQEPPGSLHHFITQTDFRLVCESGGFIRHSCCINTRVTATCRSLHYRDLCTDAAVNRKNYCCTNYPDIRRRSETVALIHRCLNFKLSCGVN